MRCVKSVTFCAKVGLCLFNIWVLCVILVVVLGHWRGFEGDLSLGKLYDDSHLVVMRELKEEAGSKSGGNSSKMADSAPFKEPEVRSAVQQEVADRVSAMSEWCRRLNPRSKDVGTMPPERTSMFLVDTQHKLLFCQIPGVAVNDWRRIFIYLTGKVNVTSHLKISAYDAHTKYAKLLPKLSDFPPEERRRIMRESLKVLFVRDPFERLLSTYQNKFQARYSKYFHETFGKGIVKKYRRNATAESLKSGSDVRFGEFVRFVLDSEHETPDGPLNEHWERYYKQCQPCAFQYDFVGKFETVVEDTKEVLTRAKVLNKLKPPYVADTFRNSDSGLRNAFREVSLKDLKRLWKMYYPDYNLFSYPYPDVLSHLLPKADSDY